MGTRSGSPANIPYEVPGDDLFNEMRQAIENVKNAIACDRMWSKEDVDNFFAQEYGIPPDAIFNHREGDINIIHHNDLLENDDFAEPLELKAEFDEIEDPSMVNDLELKKFFDESGHTTTKVEVTKTSNEDREWQISAEIHFATKEDSIRAQSLNGRVACGAKMYLLRVENSVKPYRVMGLENIRGFQSGRKHKVRSKLTEIFEKYGTEVKIFLPENERGEMEPHCYVRINESEETPGTDKYNKHRIHVKYIDFPTRLLKSKWDPQVVNKKRRPSNSGKSEKSKRAKLENSSTFIERKVERAVYSSKTSERDVFSSKTIADMRGIIAICNDALTKIGTIANQKNFSDAMHSSLKRRFTISRFSWIEHSPEIIPPQYTQDTGNCWAVALFRQWFCLINQLRLPLSTKDTLSIEKIEAGVDAQFIGKTKGICHTSHASHFMESQKYISEMIVHAKPEDLELEADFENRIEELLKVRPISASMWTYPSYDDRECRGVISPTELERKYSKYEEEGSGHNFLLLGCGIDHTTGKPIPYWEGFESQGDMYGEAGFFRLRRGQGLILEVVELKVDERSVNRARKNDHRRARKRNARRRSAR